MSPGNQKAGLDIDQSVASQKREWIFQRIGWLALFLFLAAAVLGLLGGLGPLANARTSSGTLAVEYSRFERFGAPVEMQVTVGPTGDDRLRLRVDRRLTETYTVQQVHPQPDSVRVTNGAYVYTFSALPDESSRITFNLQPDKLGKNRLQLATGTGSVTINPFTLP